MEIIPIISTLLAYGFIFLAAVVLISFTISKYRKIKELKIIPIENEEISKQIIKKKINEAQVRIIADKQEIRKITAEKQHSEIPRKKNTERKVTVINNTKPSRYEVLNEHKNYMSVSGGFSYSGNI
ncbi:MAG: hypothetical protein GXX85_00435 [Ignavibacteria bacterium]|nr:hypothetical protein [Ignavibacteria bacterium]